MDAGDRTSQYRVLASWDVAGVPAGFPVKFCLLTAGDRQYVSYYDEQNRMTVASRTVDSPVWSCQVLPSKVGWDSHNYLTMAVDDTGQLHVSGNMHCVPLIYFRTEKPGDITTLTRRFMIQKNEQRCTYPQFNRVPEGKLLFHYRDGSSGNGNEIYNVYDSGTKQWSRLMDQPLMDGHGQMNAYIAGPIRGPDGWFHMHWVWRDTPDCASNHHLSYARSRDMVHWESAFGDKIDLPISLDKPSLWVDPVPSGGGIINGGHKLFFDPANQPVISYHKSDANGNMQIYAARPEGASWTRQVLTDWQTSIPFSGKGSMGFIGIQISEMKRLAPGILTMTYRHRDYGTGHLVIHEKSLRPLKEPMYLPPEYPESLRQIQSSFKGMEIRRFRDIGDSGEKGVHYLLQWETLGHNRDLPAAPPLPEPGTLKLFKLAATDWKMTSKPALGDGA